MRRTLLAVAVLLLLVTAATAQEAAPSPFADTGPQLANLPPALETPTLALKAAPAEPSPWFSEVKPCTLKTVDTLTSIGAGLAVNVYRWKEARSLWSDICLFYDGGQKVVGGFLGLSTERKGLPIIEQILAAIDADCVGLGVSYDGTQATPTAYASWHF